MQHMEGLLSLKPGQRKILSIATCRLITIGFSTEFKKERRGIFDVDYFFRLYTNEIWPKTGYTLEPKLAALFTTKKLYPPVAIARKLYGSL